MAARGVVILLLLVVGGGALLARGANSIRQEVKALAGGTVSLR